VLLRAPVSLRYADGGGLQLPRLPLSLRFADGGGLQLPRLPALEVDADIAHQLQRGGIGADQDVLAVVERHAVHVVDAARA
ncbi:hypothetical protein FGX02_00570, partial [Xylella fastidiosa subsp. multiplex]|uniref:hypothetical protein n=1 Tax=Xylella fastidiosa TaxID=2371 RepID=UPI00132910CF